MFLSRLSARPTSDDRRRKIVAFMFKTFASQSIGYSALAAQMNDLGMRTQYGGRWEHHLVRDVLKNPIYCGYYCWNKKLGGAKYNEMLEGRIVSLDRPRVKVRRDPTNSA